jgi:uncharacterized protein YndB with AHSA1/START domain
MAASTSAVATAERELVISRRFDAPRQLVWRAWTQAERAALWWGPQGHTTIACAMDVRPGGAWRRDMRAADGSRYCKHGIYREVVEPERLVFTYVTEDATGVPDQETLVTVTFAERGGKTELTLRHALFETVAARVSHQGGWTSCLERFAAYLTTI